MKKIELTCGRAEISQVANQKVKWFLKVHKTYKTYQILHIFNFLFFQVFIQVHILQNF